MYPRSTDSAGELRAPRGLRAWTASFGMMTAADAAWFAMVGLLLALSPVTGAGRPIAAAVLGVLGGAIALAIRLRLRVQEGPRPDHRTFFMPTGTTWAVVLGALALMTPILPWLYGEYTESIWRNPQGLFVAFFAVLLARHELRKDSDPTPQASGWGFALLLPGCTLAVLDAGIRSHYITLLGLLLILPGLSLLLLGTRRTRLLAFPLAFCVFLLPLPNGLSDPLYLPTLTSEVGESIVRAMGLPVTRVGTRFLFGNGLGIEVTQNCSGLSSFYSGCAFAVLCIRATRSWPRRLALITAPYLLTGLTNGVRLALLMLVGSNYGLNWKFDTPLHGILGTASFLVVMAGIWLLSDRRALRETLS